MRVRCAGGALLVVEIELDKKTLIDEDRIRSEETEELALETEILANDW